MGRMEQFTALLEELVAGGKLKAEDKDAAIKLAEGNPELADGYLRQADYNRVMNENKEKVEGYDKWQQWSERNLPTYNKIRDEYPRLQKLDTDYKTLEEKYNAAISGKEGDMTEAQLAAAVTAELDKRGIKNPSDAQINEAMGKVIDSKAAQLEEKFVKQTLPAHMNFVVDVVECANDYRQEFGAKMDRNEFIKFCASGSFEKTQDAYDKFVETKRLETNHKKALDAAVETARKEEREKLGNQNLPGSTANPIGEAGPALQYIRSQNPGAAKPVEGGPQPALVLGDGSAASAAAAELRAEGKA